MELGGAPVSAARRAQLEEQCDDLLERALRVHAQFHGSAAALDAWKLVRRRDALSIYRLRHERKLSAAAERAEQSAENEREYEEREPERERDVPSSESSSTSGGRERARSRSRSHSHSRARARSRSRARAKRERLLMGSGIVRGTAEAAIAGVYCDSTDQLRVVKTLLSDNFVDGAVLQVCERHPLHAPVVFAGVKWFVMKPMRGSQIVRDRDFLTYERMGRILDHARGQVFTYHVIQSIDLPEKPANRGGLVRARLSWCYLYRQLDRDWLGCFMLGEFDSGSSASNSASGLGVPRSLDDFISADRFLSAAEFRAVVRARAFSRLMSGSAELLPSSSSKRCDRCLATINKLLGGGLELCMGCKKAVCRSCRHRENVFRLRVRTGKPEREVFCQTCVDTASSMRASLESTGGGGALYSNSVGGSDYHSTGDAERRGRGEGSHGRGGASESGAVPTSSSSQSMSPAQGWNELDLDDTILSDDEDADRYLSDDLDDPYAGSYHADEGELRKLASFARRCSIVDDSGTGAGDKNSSQAPGSDAAAGAVETNEIWWNPKEMERLAKFLDKQKKRERRHRQEYDTPSDFDRPRASSDINGSAERSRAQQRARGTGSAYSGVSSNGTDRSAYSRNTYDSSALEPALTSQRSFVVYDEELHDYVRLHDPERAGLPPPAPVRRPPHGTVFSVDELD